MLILFVLTISLVSAASDDNQTLESTDNEIINIDATTGNGIGTFYDLKQQVESANPGETIELNNNYTYDTDFSLDGVIINKEVTINGNGNTLDGKNTGRIIFVSADNVILKNIVFANGYSSGGAGAISCRGVNLTITNCTFINNNALGNVAGAVYIMNGQSTITNNKFLNNTIEKNETPEATSAVAFETTHPAQA